MIDVSTEGGKGKGKGKGKDRVVVACEEEMLPRDVELRMTDAVEGRVYVEYCTMEGRAWSYVSGYLPELLMKRG